MEIRRFDLRVFGIPSRTGGGSRGRVRMGIKGRTMAGLEEASPLPFPSLHHSSRLNCLFHTNCHCYPSSKQVLVDSVSLAL